MIIFLLFFAFTTLFSFIYLGINTYFVFGSLFSSKLVFWILMFVFTQFYFIVRVISRNLNVAVPETLYFISSVIFAIVTLGMITAFCLNILYTLFKYIKPLNFLFEYCQSNPINVGLIAVGLILIQLSIGLNTTTVPKKTFYTIYNDKMLSTESVRIAHIADLHITSYTSKKFVKEVVDIINSENPEVVVVVGDMIDDYVQPYIDGDYKNIFNKLNAEYGAYITLGNHEYYGGDADFSIQEFEGSGFTVLRDSYKYLDGLGITLIGRDDLTANHYATSPRKSLRRLMEGIDHERPIISLDHQPHSFVLDEAKASGVDLQLSGHTHNGQLFPFNLLVKFIYRKAWGHLIDDKFNLIVTCGLGTWGPPIRSASYAEIVIIDMVGTK